ncbi:MAG: SDR family oxidoreductase [Anaerolineales bacterium]|nr:SDR family oxidoreductase [Anaerolineales bacterium]
MHILILGGTVFLGRALVEAALASGHEITLFNRGQSNPDLFPQVEKLSGERDGGLEALEGRRWQAVIDTCGYFPRIVRQSAELLAGAVEHYTFISTLSVYASSRQPGIAEDAEVSKLQDESVEELTGETYGPLKALCEQAVEAALPGRALIVRPGLIVGPHDRSDRFTYWPCRVARGGEVLAPGDPQRALQFIDVRDLAEWILRMIAAGRTGIYNADSPLGRLAMGGLLETCQRLSGSDANFTWVSEDFLLEQGVGAWVELPLWIPKSDPDSAGFFAFDVSKALTAGLSYRPLEETVRATLDWEASRPTGHEWRAGLAPSRERELLNIWRAQAR